MGYPKSQPKPLGLDPPSQFPNRTISMPFPTQISPRHLRRSYCHYWPRNNDAKGEIQRLVEWMTGNTYACSPFWIQSTVVQVDLHSCEKSFGSNLRKSVSQKTLSTWAVYGQVAKSRLWKDRPEPFAPQTRTLLHSAFGHILSLDTKTKAVSEPCFLPFVATCSHINKDASIKYCQHCFARQGSAGLRWRCTRYGVSPPWAKAKSHKGHETWNHETNSKYIALYSLYMFI